MQIKIEHHTEVAVTGETKHYYHVKYYRGHWWSRWIYVMRHFQHSDPEKKNFTLLSDAVAEAKKLRREYEGLPHTIEELDEFGEYPNRGQW